MGVLLDTEWADGSKRRRDDGAKKQGTREGRLSDKYRVVLELAVCHMSWLDFDNMFHAQLPNQFCHIPICPSWTRG